MKRLTALLCLCALGLLPAGARALATVAGATVAAVSPATFSRPHDLALSGDGRHLFVADVGNDVVRVLDPETLRDLGRIGENELESPHDVALDLAGRLLVADSGNDRIVVYELEGTQGRMVGELSGGLGSPEGVAVAPNGDVFVTSASSHTVTVFRAGTALHRVGGYGEAAGRFKRPHDILVDAAGRVFAVDPGNNRIVVLDRNLAPVTELGAPRHAFNEPKYLAMDERGWLYVADEYNNQVRIFDSLFNQIGEIAGGRHGDGTIRLTQPEGVTVRGDDVWVSDTGNGRIVRFRLQPSSS